MSELNRRNTETVRQALETLAGQLAAQQKQLNGLLATMGTLSSRMNEVELRVNLQKAKLAGNGPSEKP